MIIFYSVSCEGCSGNHALAKIKQLCKKNDLDFGERRTIYWDRWEKEAEAIMKNNEGLKLPFFYHEESGLTLEANSLTPLDAIEKWIDKCKEQNAG